MAEDTATAPEEVKETPAAATATEAPVAPAADAEAPKKAPKRRKVKRSVPQGQVHVKATFNNTIITFTDQNGNVLTTSSAGACGFRGSKKGTAYAAQVAAERAAQAAKQQYGFSKADVMIKGIGLGRDAAVRVLSGLDIAVESITDVTGVPHGGVRPPKARRV
ncbi:MAG TPA: 30S ribosomal protein S11 [Candidatus Saccharimonadales bacterium]|nr:30S ribosomal protein S11 [Candidatus Saccharimonadales bacterium]